MEIILYFIDCWRLKSERVQRPILQSSCPLQTVWPTTGGEGSHAVHCTRPVSTWSVSCLTSPSPSSWPSDRPEELPVTAEVLWELSMRPLPQQVRHYTYILFSVCQRTRTD